jgi:VanZ family protein
MVFILKRYARSLSLAACILYLVAIIILAVIPLSRGNNIPLLDYDKLLHFLEFFVLITLVLITFDLWRVRDKALLALIILLGMTLLSEGLQLFVLERSFNVMDMVADLAGGFCAFILFFGVKELWNMKR